MSKIKNTKSKDLERQLCSIDVDFYEQTKIFYGQRNVVVTKFAANGAKSNSSILANMFIETGSSLPITDSFVVLCNRKYFFY